VLSDAEVTFIGTWDDAPKYVQDNEYIHTGYRINFNSPRKIFRSLFMPHNELVNVWTHLIGAILFLILTVCIIVKIESTFSIPAFNKLKEKFEVEEEFAGNQSKMMLG
jgi:adiponectin receptor